MFGKTADLKCNNELNGLKRLLQQVILHQIFEDRIPKILLSQFLNTLSQTAYIMLTEFEL